MPEKINWISHHYTHLMKQPTLFYAAVMMLVLAVNGVLTTAL